MLSDITIGCRATSWDMIDPYHSEQQQPCSYDLTLSKDIKLFEPFYKETECYITAYDRELHGVHYVEEDISLYPDGVYELAPGQFIIASTNETVKLPNDIAGRFEGKSSLGRLGLTTHVTAGFIDAGFEGQITLEMKNENRFPIRIKRGMKIGQICFFYLDRTCAHPYGEDGLGSHYQGQSGPTTARC